MTLKASVLGGLRRDVGTDPVSVRTLVVSVSTAAVLTLAVLAVPGSASLVARSEWLGLAAILAVCLLVEIDLVDGGRVSIAGAVIIAYAAGLRPGVAALAVGLGLLAAHGWLRCCDPARTGLPWVRVVAASAAAIAARAAVGPLVVRLGMHGDVAALTHVLAAGIGFFAVELGARWLLAPTTGGRSDRACGVTASLIGVEAAMLCVAALLVVAGRQLGPLAVLVAAGPLLIIQYSFARYARARQTYDQAIRALGVVPEVAGQAAPGHGERTAFYASALARAFGLNRRQTELVATAARIHHVGAVLDGGGPAATADMLREVGFLAGVADLVAAVEDEDTACTHLWCAIVRVASRFDELVGEDEDLAAAAGDRLLGDVDNAAERVVVVSLVQLCRTQEGLVAEAIRQGRYLALPPLSDILVLSDHDHGAHPCP